MYKSDLMSIHESFDGEYSNDSRMVDTNKVNNNNKNEVLLTLKDTFDSAEISEDGISKICDYLRYFLKFQCCRRKQKIHNFEESLFYSSGESDHDAALEFYEMDDEQKEDHVIDLW